MEQFGVPNPFYVAYNLVPFSWLLDYFIPVGEWLQSLMPPAGVSYEGGYSYLKGRFSLESVDDRGGAYLPVYAVGEFKFRVARSDIFAVRLKPADLSLTKGQIGNALALLTSIVTSRR
jgi:hypothetical protein